MECVLNFYWSLVKNLLTIDISDILAAPLSHNDRYEIWDIS